MDVFYGMMQSIQKNIRTSDQAILIVNWLIGKRPKEIDDALTALHLEGGTERLHKALLDRTAKLEESKALLDRYQKLFVSPPKEPPPRMFEKLRTAVKKKILSPTAETPAGATPQA